MLVEVAGGLFSGSLALLADAGHMFTDVAALGLSLFAFWLSGRPQTSRRTFGWRRFEIFAAFVNGIALWVIAVVIGYEAYQRLSAPPEIRSGMMMAVAAAGPRRQPRRRGRPLPRPEGKPQRQGGVPPRDGRRARQRRRPRRGPGHPDHRGLRLGPHRQRGRLRPDPAELGSPDPGVLPRVHGGRARAPGRSSAIREALAAIPGVAGVHDLHVWTITSGFVSLSAHLDVRGGRDVAEVIRDAHAVVSARFGILHTTFQPELGEGQGCDPSACR